MCESAGMKPVWVSEVYRKHKWRLDKDGNIDEFAMEYDYHNGPACERCHESFCMFCVKDYEAELEKGPCDCSRYECPTCHHEVSFCFKKPYCADCGQKLDWQDVKSPMDMSKENHMFTEVDDV